MLALPMQFMFLGPEDGSPLKARCATPPALLPVQPCCGGGSSGWNASAQSSCGWSCILLQAIDFGIAVFCQPGQFIDVRAGELDPAALQRLLGHLPVPHPTPSVGRPCLPSASSLSLTTRVSHSTLPPPPRPPPASRHAHLHRSRGNQLCGACLLACLPARLLARLPVRPPASPPACPPARPPARLRDRPGDPGAGQARSVGAPAPLCPSSLLPCVTWRQCCRSSKCTTPSLLTSGALASLPTSCSLASCPLPGRRAPAWLSSTWTSRWVGGSGQAWLARRAGWCASGGPGRLGYHGWHAWRSLGSGCVK